jgi:hypothetical protein
LGNLKQRDQLEVLGMEGNIAFKWILSKNVVTA